MIGLYVLGTLLIGGALFAIFDDDDGGSTSDTDRDTDQQLEPELPTEEGDLLQLSDDDDDVQALGGDDTVSGGAGNDQISGNAGEDDISGQAGDDLLTGGSGADVLNSGSGNDTVIGNTGADTLFGSSGEDVLAGANDDDLLVGGSGADLLQGGDGDDVLFGGEFDREPTAEELRDAAAAASPLDLTMQNSVSGQDTLIGGDGDDTLYLGPRDFGTGGAGEDSFVVLTDNTAQGIVDISDFDPFEDSLEVQVNDPDSTLTLGNFDLQEDVETGEATVLQNGVTIARIADGAGQVTLDDISFVRVSEDGTLVPLSEAPDAAALPPGVVEGTDFDDRIELEGEDAETISAEAGDDTVFAGAGDDNVSGGTGDDALYGQGGDDTLAGGAGDDIVYASNGDDALNGGDGSDLLFGSAGEDSLSGGDEDDILVGGSGDDELSGGDGNDIVYGGEFDRVPNLSDATALRGAGLSDLSEALSFETTASGADVLNGDAGDDLLLFGATDSATGGTGADTFLVLSDDTPEGPAFITDFDADEDQIQIGIPEDQFEDLDRTAFSVVTDADTGDALIMQDDVVLVRVADAGGQVSIDQLSFTAY